MITIADTIKLYKLKGLSDSSLDSARALIPFPEDTRDTLLVWALEELVRLTNALDQLNRERTE